METTIFSEKEVEEAAHVLREGGLVAFPTETVYGLGAPLFSSASIAAIFRVKKRPADNPLIVHLSDLAQVEEVAQNVPSSFFELARAFFPGPLTLVVKKHSRVPSIVSAGLDTIALRIPSHPIAHRLIAACETPLVAPSANLSGRPSSTCAQHVLDDFDGQIAAVLDGGSCPLGIESTVVDLISFGEPTLLRPGGVTQEALEEVLGKKIALYSKGVKSSPGMRYRHYAPQVPVRLFTDKERLVHHLATASHPLILSTTSLECASFPLEAQTLYRYLRLADQKGYSEVVIFCDRPLDPALQNRLDKAAEA